MLDITLKEDGVKTSATHDELSADGKFFTTTETEFRPDQPVFTSRIAFLRLSGSDGFVGKWRDTSHLQEFADMNLRLDNQALHIDYPRAGQQIDAPLDGVEATVRGAQVPEAATRTVRPAGNREFRIITKRYGKVLSRGSLELSDDGSTITDSWWNPNEPAVKATFVYEKK